MGKWISFLTLVVAACMLLPVPATAQTQSPPEDAGADQYSRDGPTTSDGLAALSYLGIDGPEDFDYCDDQGCHLLGPSGKEFFACDPSWSCRYILWGSYELGPGDFDYLQVEARDPDYGEVGSCYACGPTEVCLNVASYECDAAGNCIYRMGGIEKGGLEDAVPEAGESARRALEGFGKALENVPATKTRSALAEELDPSEAAAAEGTVERGNEVDQAGADQAGAAKPDNSFDGNADGNVAGNATNGGNAAGGSPGEQSLAGGSDSDGDDGSGGGNASDGNASDGGVLSAAGSLSRNPALLVLGTLVALGGGAVLLLLKAYR